MTNLAPDRAQIETFDDSYNRHPTMTKVDCCGKRVFVAWFAPWSDRGVKCGEHSNPRRAEAQRVFADHDAGDEDRTFTP